MRPFPFSLGRRLRRDDGFTLIEMSIVGALLSVVVGATVLVMNGAQTNLGREISRADSNDQVRLAMQSVDRDVRSGDVLYNPADEVYAAGEIAPGMSMRIYTESNQPTRGKRCVQWRITSDGELQQRNWAPTDPAGTNTGWRITATGITNRAEAVAAFARPNPGTLNIVNIVLRANTDATKGKPVQVDASVSGRNTTFFSASEPCGPASPAPVSGPDGIPAY
jgi:prepilin-type N-terminal cleavage/methylation domain-containing protein